MVNKGGVPATLDRGCYGFSTFHGVCRLLTQYSWFSQYMKYVEKVQIQEALILMLDEVG